LRYYWSLCTPEACTASISIQIRFVLTSHPLKMLFKARKITTISQHLPGLSDGLPSIVIEGIRDSAVVVFPFGLMGRPPGLPDTGAGVPETKKIIKLYVLHTIIID